MAKLNDEMQEFFQRWDEQDYDVERDAPVLRGLIKRYERIRDNCVTAMFVQTTEQAIAERIGFTREELVEGRDKANEMLEHLRSIYVLMGNPDGFVVVINRENYHEAVSVLAENFAKSFSERSITFQVQP